MENKYIEEKKLVTVERISNVSKHPNADNLYIVQIQGYNVLINLKTMYGDINPQSLINQQVVYFQIDSVLPEAFKNQPFWEYLDCSYMGKRIKSVKLRGVVSQGLILNINSVKNIFTDFDTNVMDGQNLTNYFGVIKYYQPYDIEGPFYNGSSETGKIIKSMPHESLRPFPQCIPKTDQPRLQSNMNLLNNADNRLFTATIKYDGQSTTWYHNNGKTGVCSRNFEIDLEYDKETSERYKESDRFRFIEKKYNIFDKLLKLKLNIAIQGELYGNMINGNHHCKKDIDLAVFDIYDIDNKMYMNHHDVKRFCSELELKMVDIVFEDEKCISKNIQPWLDIANKQTYKNDTNKILPAEGIVVKSSDGHTPYISFKVISQEFLLKKG